MNVRERIAALRAVMKQRGFSAYIVPSADPHMSETLPAYYRARAWFSGFTGSAGTLVVTTEHAALWTDGRYFIQAERELFGSGIELMKMREPETPALEQWLAQHVNEKAVVALDGLVSAMDLIEKLRAAFEEKQLVLTDCDLTRDLWTQSRPALPATQVWELEVKYAGKTAEEKLCQLRQALEKEQANATLVSRLDSVAWLLNIRASDIINTPFAMAYCLVLPDCAMLFINRERVPYIVEERLRAQGVVLYDYAELAQQIAKIQQPVIVLYEPAGLSYRMYEAFKNNSYVTMKSGEEPVAHLKGIKNDVEIENIKNAHIKDGVVMVRFAMWLQSQMKAGQRVTECEISTWLQQARAEQAEYLSESFGTIAAYGANAAMMHYAPLPETCATVQATGFLLVDSGGQYRDGTTDLTRTYAVGPLTEEERRLYTLVLKCHIDIAMAVFKDGMAGHNLDIIARQTLWREGLDYRCGTGHGIGFVGGVHEGPQNLSFRGTTPFVPGMLITDEPGVYEEGRLGIRIENELLCKEYRETEYGKFYCFEPITYCPIDTTPVLTELLTQEEKQWLNTYHVMVQKVLSPSLTEAEQQWLKQACAPID